MNKKIATALVAVSLLAGSIISGDSDSFKSIMPEITSEAQFSYQTYSTISKVSNFHASKATANSITLSWNKMPEANGYIIYKYDNGWKRHIKTSSNLTSYTFKDLKPCTTYKFAIKAYKTVNGKEVASNSYPYITVTTKLKTVTNFKAIEVSSNQIKLTWNKIPKAKGYVVYKYEDKWKRHIKTSSNLTSYTFKDLKPCTTYKFAIRAYKTVNGKEILSESYPYVTVTTKLKTVTDFKTAKISSTQIKLTWDKIPEANGYIIYKYDNGWKRHIKTSSNLTSYTFKDLKPCTTYKFAAKAYNTVNNKEIVSETYPHIAVTTKLKTVTNFKAVKLSSTQAKLSWTNVSGAEGYVIYKFDTAINKWVRINKSKCSGSFIVSIGSNEIPRYAIRAYKTINGKEILSESYPTAYLKLRSVSGLKRAGSSCNKMRLEWNNESLAEKYVVYRYSKDDKKYVQVAETKNTYAIFKNIPVGTNELYAVQCCGTLPNGKVIKSDYSKTYAATLPRNPSFSISTTSNYGYKNVYLKWKPVSGAKKYIVYKRPIDGCWSRVTVTTGTSYTIKNIPANSYYYVTVKAVAEYDGEEYNGNYTTKLICPDSVMKNGKTLYSCGDSIAYGAGSHGLSYAYMFAEKHNMNPLSCAISGATLSNDSTCANIPDEVLNKAIKPFDIAFVEGGLNDYYHGNKLGKVTPSGTTKFDRNTACGGLETIFYHFRSKYPKTKLYYISIHQVNNVSTKKNSIGLTYRDYLNQFLKICKKYDVTVIDYYNDSGFDTSKESLKSKYTTKSYGVYPDGDGIHPTETGYSVWYMPLLEKTFSK